MKVHKVILVWHNLMYYKLRDEVTSVFCNNYIEVDFCRVF